MGVDSKLQHPNIVGLVGACLEPPNLCMVMELCDRSLHHALHNTNVFYSAQQLTRLAVGLFSRVQCIDLMAKLKRCSYSFCQGDIAAGMCYLHSLSPAVIHRCVTVNFRLQTLSSILHLDSDLKSANVLLDKKGTAKICDFGLVRYGSHPPAL